MNISGFSSTNSLLEETRSSIARLQAQLVNAQKELSSGRLADVGLTLGANTGKVINFQQELSFTQSVIDANGLVSTRMQAGQIGLQSMSDLAQDFLSALTNTKLSSDVSNTTVQSAQAGLKSFTDLINTSVSGQFVFSGVNSDVKPLDDYFAATAPASKQNFDAAFLAKFGITQQDPAVSAIPAATMKDFLDNEYAAQFTDTTWSANWSAASDKNVRNRISRTEVVETSVNANDPAFRKIASAFALVADSGFEKLNDQARQAVLDRAISQLGDGITGIATLQSKLGISQERVSTSNDILGLQKNLMTTSIDNLVGVDPAEVSTRLSTLMTQIETAYTITNRLNNLSLLNYLTP